MNKRDREKAQENLPQHLKSHRVVGRSLLHFCCSQSMVKLKKENNIYGKGTIYYCLECRHEEPLYLKQMRCVPDTFS